MPLLPLLGLGIAGWLEAMRPHRLAWGAAALAGVLGFLVNLPAVVNNYLPTLLALTKRYPAPVATEGEAAARAFNSWGEAPFLTLWQSLAPGNSDIAWLWGERGLDATALVVSLLLLGLAYLYLWLAYRRPGTRGLRLAPLALGVACLLGVTFLLPRYAAHPHYGSDGYRQALGQFATMAAPNATLVTLDTTMQVAFNFQTGNNPRYGLSGNLNTTEVPPELDRLLQGRIREGGEVWLVALEPEVRTVERRLRELLPAVHEWEYGTVRLLRLRDR